MIKYLKIHKFLILSLLIFLAGLIIDKRQSKIHKQDIDTEQFETVLHKKEQKIKELVESISVKLENQKNLLDFKTKTLFNPAELEKLKAKGFSVIIYKNDTLTYWSDNLFDVDFVYNQNQFSGQCVFIPNYWLDVYIKDFEEYKIIVAYRIKSKFEKENKYLQDNFQQDLDISNSFKISLIPLSFGIDVKNIEGQYLLSLIPNNNVYTDYKYEVLVGILYLLCFFFLILYFNSIFQALYIKKRGRFKVIISLGLIIILRVLTIYLKFPLNVYSHDFFDSQFFATSFIFPSLGDLFINVLIILLVFLHFFKLIYKSNKQKNKKTSNQTFDIFILFIGTFIFLNGITFIRSFVINSNIPLNLYNILDLNIYSLIGFVNIGIVLFAIIYFFYKSIEYIYKDIKLISLFLRCIGGIAAAILFYFLIFKDINIPEIVILIVINFATILFLKNKATSSFYFLSTLSFFAAVLITFVLINSLNQKQTDKFSVLAVDLTNERDDVAELLLNDILSELPKDETLQTYAENPNLNNIETEVQDYLRRRYFKTYWNKYDVSVQLCSDKKKARSDSLLNCNIKYSNLFQQKGTALNWSNAYFISYNNGKTAYIIKQRYSKENVDTAVFYITLSPKLYPSNIGYPELLLDESVDLKRVPGYSYAKYENNEMVLKSGDYNYPLNGKYKFKADKKLDVLNDEKYKHIVYTFSNGNYIVLTYKKITFLNSIITFSYIFLVFIIFSGLTLLFININSIIKIKNFNFRTKLIFSVLGVLTISFTLVGAFTVLLNVNQFRTSHKNEVIEKLHQINISLEQYYRKEENNFYKNKDELNNNLRHLAEVFGTDINLYDSTGFLMATSRPEIYNLNLIAKRVSASALYKIEHKRLVQFILNEQINLLKYSSAYAQFVDKNNNLLAIINMPYFTNPDALRSEISNLIVSIVNIYVVLFVIAMIISVLISEQIISPLIILQNKFTKLELGKKYEKVEYKRKDEIGQLVNEYNKMVDKLKESIDKLSKSERESAWRDMAKQIAHEIKNPLTPMKLSIQLLMRSWENQDEDFDERIREFSSSLVTQIETLKRIAEEFSDFAKMPKPQETVFNLADKIEEVCKLYENTENVDVIARLQNYRKALIYADEKQISRALINLVKNSIQAIADGVQGKIIIDLDVFGNKAIVKIVDNGTGIPEDLQQKLFVPSFTTKSSGMGLGLTMVKKIIENARGSISFKSQQGEGTTFIVEFPLHKKDV